jgi:hypothetical protein
MTQEKVIAIWYVKKGEEGREGKRGGGSGRREMGNGEWDISTFFIHSHPHSPIAARPLLGMP